MVALSSFLGSKGTKLASLDVSSNDLTGPHCDVRDGVTALMNGVRRNMSLKVLDLRNNDVLVSGRHRV